MAETGFTQAVLDSPSGAKLAIYTRSADSPARGIVHVNHGLAECASRYAPFADYLASRGYHTIAQDHRGHGHTTAEDGGARRFADKDGWNKLMADVKAVEDHAKSLWPDLPLVVFGHSMGAVITTNHVMREPDSVAAAAIWNGNMAIGGMKAVMRLILFFEALVGGPNTPSLTIDKMTFNGWSKRFPDHKQMPDSTSVWLSRDLEQVRLYDENPICGWPSSVSLWRDFLSGVAFAEDNANFANIAKDKPFHLIGGSKDPATNNGKTVRHLYKRLKKAGFKDVEFQILKGFRHETLNEIGREQQMELFADWLDKVTG